MVMKHTKRLGVVLSMVVLVAFGFILGTTVLPGVAGSPVVLLESDPFQTVSTQTLPALTEREQALADIYNRISPSVVAISVSIQRRQGQGLFPFGSGSGFVIDREGHIVTNNHVVDEGDRIEINFFDGTIVEAEVVGVDPDSDLAVLDVDIPPDSLVPVEFADSSLLQIGQSTVALGSPFGQKWTMTTGIISALDRDIQGLEDYSIGGVIQTDAAINPGNSGGPLLDLQGRVIGVNSQIASEARSNSGIGFAVPSNLVERVVDDLIATGQVHYSYLGINSAEITLHQIETFDLPNNLRGVVISRVVEGSPAAQAGLRSATNNSADVITAIEGVSMTSFGSLIGHLSSYTVPGDVVDVTVFRDGQIITLPVTLGARR
jgi:2-alkenal reductase